MCLERLDLLRRIALEKTVTQNRDLSLCARLLFEKYDEYQPVFLSGPALLACMKLGLTCATGGLENRPGPPSDLRTWFGRPPDSLQTSVSNGSGPSLRVRVRVQTELLPNWRSGSSINPNCPLGYGSMVNSQPV